MNEKIHETYTKHKRQIRHNPLQSQIVFMDVSIVIYEVQLRVVDGSGEMQTEKGSQEFCSAATELSPA